MTVASPTPRFRAASSAIAASLLAWIPAFAADTLDTALPADEWRFEASLYGYLPKLHGTTSFPGFASNVTVDTSAIIDHLKFTFMGTLEARRGSWGAFTDILYVDLGGSKQLIRGFGLGDFGLPAGAFASGSLDMKATLWTLAGTYRAIAQPGATLDVLFGVRLLDIRQTLDWQLAGNVATVAPPLRGGERETSQSNWDGIVGIKGRVALSGDRRWFLPYYLDVGTGQSDSTWQAMTGIGYAFQWGDVIAGWRYLDYRMKSGRPIQDIGLSGGLLAVTMRW
ncbi:hypothetical protein WKW77_05610 [Variovorax ureilyticus]|uniref:Outer membrane protein beta-barrel domain-containing protein n=1 Tax=Variovorax ureilyticus TaxID=1836198 RepID=A0ABU8VA67_9BURK